MLRIDIIAAGRLKAGPLAELWADYKQRLPWPLTLIEIDGRNAAEEQLKLAAKIAAGAYLFVLDEKGQSLPSRAFAEKLNGLAEDGRSHVQFLIGGANGHSAAIRQRADCLLALGQQTWPHMLARVMLLEQIYRARQIIAGHPYHRD